MVRSRSRRVVALAPAVALLLGMAALAGPASAQVTKLKVGWCARTVSAAAAPFAIAAKLGWLKQEGIDVELVPMPGSTDCVKNVAVREVDFSLPSVEPLGVLMNAIAPSGAPAIATPDQERRSLCPAVPAKAVGHCARVDRW